MIIENTDKENEFFSQRLIAEVRRQKILCKEINDPFAYLHKYELELKGIEPSDCVLIHGSVQLVKTLQKQLSTKLWVPHSWCQFNEFECSFYYPKLSQYLLNKEYVMLPLSSLLTKKEWIFNHIDPEIVFIKPDKGNKTFTGFAVSKNKFDDEIKSLIDDFRNENILVIVAKAQEIMWEWRFCIADSVPVTGSQYMYNNDVSFSASVPSAAYKLAAEIAGKNVFSDKMYCIDICATEKEYSLLEVNSFSSSCLYESNYSLIVTEAKRLAQIEWAEFNLK